MQVELNIMHWIFKCDCHKNYKFFNCLSFCAITNLIFPKENYHNEHACFDLQYTANLSQSQWSSMYKKWIITD